MKLDELLEGLNLIESNQPDAEIAFDSNAIYVGDSHGPMDEFDNNELVELGWNVNEDCWVLLLQS